MSFLTAAALGMSAVLVSAIVCASGIAIYAIRVADLKTDNLPDLIQQAAQSLPAIRASLPPALADAFDDVRRPDYRDQLHVTAKLSDKKTRWNGRRAIVTIENRGDKIVSLMSLRVVGLDEDGEPVRAEPLFAATPIQIDNDWRGPLLPRESRRMIVNFYRDEDIATVAEEITEVRVWTGKDTPPAQIDSSAAAADRPEPS